MDKFKQVFDMLINEDKSGATQLFHEIVVENGRNIYKEIAQEQGIAEAEEAKEEDDKDLDESADCKEYDGQNPNAKMEKADLKEDDMSELSDEVSDEEDAAGDDAGEEEDSSEEPDGEMEGGDEDDDLTARMDDLEAAMAEIIANMDGMDDEAGDEMAPAGDELPGDEDPMGDEMASDEEMPLAAGKGY